MRVLSLDARKRDHEYSGLNKGEARFSLRYIASISESKVSFPAPTITCIAQRSKGEEGEKARAPLFIPFKGMVRNLHMSSLPSFCWLDLSHMAIPGTKEAGKCTLYSGFHMPS